MMMFRKLYWVAEEVQATGESRVRGVYTSIPNLIRQGLEEGVDLSCCRLSLTRLDSCCGAVATWSGARFSTIGEDLVQFVQTEDMTEDQRQSLVRWISEHLMTAA